MQVVRQTHEVAHVHDPAIRDFLQRRIAEMEPNWAPDSWEDYGQFLILEPDEDPSITETVNCHSLVTSPFSDAKLGELGFSPVWEWVEDHGKFFEIGVVTSDAGNFDSYVIPKTGMPQALLDLCAEHASQFL